MSNLTFAPETYPNNSLAHLREGQSGRIRKIDVKHTNQSINDEQLEHKLMELGFIEGAEVTIFCRRKNHSLIAQLDNNSTMIALRTKQAEAILLR